LCTGPVDFHFCDEVVLALISTQKRYPKSVNAKNAINAKGSKGTKKRMVIVWCPSGMGVSQWGGRLARRPSFPRKWESRGKRSEKYEQEMASRIHRHDREKESGEMRRVDPRVRGDDDDGVRGDDRVECAGMTGWCGFPQVWG